MESVLCYLDSDDAIQRGKDEALKDKLKFEHLLGLGPQPNAIPPDDADVETEPRPVRVGWHPVAGFAGKWFAEKTGLGQFITQHIHKYPDPTQHWAVLVGDYCHELWMNEDLDVIYINERVKQEEWHTFDVGRTTFNDEALRQAGEMVIFKMRQKKPGYNMIDNNCQIFALQMLDAIQIGKHRAFATAFTVYQGLTGRGNIKGLFKDAPDEEQAQEPVVEHAQQVMEENTTKLDNHRQLFHFE